MFPGQGSQKPGMGRDLAEGYPAARDVFAAADSALGESLSAAVLSGWYLRLVRAAAKDWRRF